MSNQKFFKGKGFYIVAAAVLLAVGGITRLTLGADIKPDKNYASSSYNFSSTITGSKVNSTESFSGKATASESSSKISSSLVPDSSSASKAADSSKSEQAAANKVVAFAMPIKGSISKQFDVEQLQYSKTYGDMRVHTGIDIISEEGTPVKCTANGTVSIIKEDPLWGKMVVVDHGNDILSYYCGLNDVSVKQGDKVKMSKILGTVGETPCECLDTPHLHFAIKNKGEWVSPLKAMGLEG